MGTSVTFPITGKFDLNAAFALRNRIAEVSAGSTVTVDFSQTQEVPDLALAAFVRFLADLSYKVKARGLSQHQLSILRHLHATDVLDAEGLADPRT